MASSPFPVSQQMTHTSTMTSPSVAKPSETLPLVAAQLTDQQLERLSRCAKGISLRFESSEIVDALVAGGYAEKGVGGLVTVTDKGQQYLRTHAS